MNLLHVFAPDGSSVVPAAFSDRINDKLLIYRPDDTTNPITLSADLATHNHPGASSA